MNKNIED